MPVSPQTENGFVMVALDLFAAILTADLPNREMIVLSEVLLQSYGPMKRRDVLIDPPTVEHFSGLHRNNVRAAVRGLVAANILRANEDGSYRFIKDYESWKPGNKPLVDRLVGGILRFARSALIRFGPPPKSIKESKKDPIQPDCPSTFTPIQPDWGTSVGPNLVELGQTTVTQSNEIVCTIGTRASEEFKSGEKKSGEGEKSDTHTGPDSIPSSPQRDDEDAELIHEAARLLAGDIRTQHLAMEVRNNANLSDLIHFEGWRFLLAANVQLSSRVTEAQRKKWSYFVGIVKGFDPEERPAAPAPGPVVNFEAEMTKRINARKGAS